MKSLSECTIISFLSFLYIAMALPVAVIVNDGTDSSITSCESVCNLRSAVFKCMTYPSCIINLNVYEILLSSPLSIEGDVMLSIQPLEPNTYAVISPVTNHAHKFLEIFANSFEVDFTMSNLLIRNFSDLNGGSMYFSGLNSVSIINSKFDNNHGIYGGSLHFDYSNSNIEIINTTCVNNFASTSGGCAHFGIDNTNITISGSNMTNNRVSGRGGAITFENYNSDIHIIDCAFNDNMGGYDGGALFFRTGIDEVVIMNSVFERNSAKVGSIISYDSFNSGIRLTNNRFAFNTFSGSSGGSIEGGLVFREFNGPITIDSCDFYNNDGFDYGGAVDVWYDNHDVLIINSNFVNNHADYGGAIAYYSRNHGQIINSTFVNNHADYGGAIFNYDYNDLSIYDSLFHENHADFGGAYYIELDGNHVRCAESIFMRNSAGISGAVACSADEGDLNTPERNYHDFTGTNTFHVNESKVNDNYGGNLGDFCWLSSIQYVYAFVVGQEAGGNINFYGHPVVAKPGSFAALIPKVSIGSMSLIPFHSVDTHEIFVYKRGFVVGDNISYVDDMFSFVGSIYHERLYTPTSQLQWVTNKVASTDAFIVGVVLKDTSHSFHFYGNYGSKIGSWSQSRGIDSANHFYTEEISKPGKFLVE